MSADRFSGVLEVTVTARTPLLIGGFPDTDSGDPDVPRAYDRRAIIPGSGLMGAVRSLHEALVGGCLRVLDLDLVPVHRHPANTSETTRAGLCLAVVTGVDAAGVAKSVRLCDQWVWIPERLVPRSRDRLPRTGDRLSYQPREGPPEQFPDGALTGTKDRKVLRARSDKFPQGVVPSSVVRTGEMGAVTDDCWVLLVTDTQARQSAQPYFAAGRVGRDAKPYGVPEGTWKHYLDTVEGADDLRPESLKDSNGKEPSWKDAGPQYKGVSWPQHEGDRGEVIAERLPARRYLYVGQPVWVRVDRTEQIVTEIRLSELWRYRGDGPVGDRIGAARPCTDSVNLCWSCRVFGSADTSGRGADDLAVQSSYRGHVRVDDLSVKGSIKPLIWHLAPLSSPRPGAGQFYLDNTGRPRVAEKDTKPIATWGSVADKPQPRRIRGRKFYWRTEDPEHGEFPRGRRRDHQSETLSKKVALFPAGTVFTGRVCFDNLSVEDYGSLLTALDPRLLAQAEEAGSGWADVVSSLGGGKPFGFGSVTIDVNPVSVQTASTRYLGEAGQQPAMTEVVEKFNAAVPRPVRQTWQALRHALTFGFVPDELVWYPPGGDDSVAKGDEDFDKSFEFFPKTSGIELSKEKRQHVALPDAAGTADAQVLDSRGDVQRTSARQQRDRS